MNENFNTMDLKIQKIFSMSNYYCFIYIVLTRWLRVATMLLSFVKSFNHIILTWFASNIYASSQNTKFAYALTYLKKIQKAYPPDSGHSMIKVPGEEPATTVEWWLTPEVMV